jgi:hypothetical protein
VQTPVASAVFDKLFCDHDTGIPLNVETTDEYLKLMHPLPKKKDKDLPVTMPKKEYGLLS